MKFVLATLVVLASVTSFAEGKMAQGADAQSVDNSCSADATTAGCGTEKVGTGLMKCLHTYKKAHHDFKFSDSCKAAMKQMHKDHKGA